jgi:aspartyl-tRNA(Asn)/glutamyl-tRNA(Gln) amidotransferase subunit B
MEYIVTIGLEIHVEIHTRSKMFCACPNKFGGEPNTHVCPVCLGYPGVLPTPNNEAIRKTILAGFMIDSEIPDFCKFDRKAYWYPDMAKNYQITQYDLPFCVGGKVRIEGKSLVGEVGPRDVKVTRIHLEEDVAKSSHEGSATGIDFNRAGVPLMEIVSEPDMSSADEAYAYLQAIKEIMQYAGVSECSMEKGQMRCDVNVSVRPSTQEEFNKKTEIKNLNSFKAVHRSIEYEIERQIDMIEDEEPFRQQTRGWNDDRGETYVMREKEDADDYRYFPEPDLMPVLIDDAMRDEIRGQMPETPSHRRHRFMDEHGLPAYDAQVLCAEKGLADWYEEVVAAGADAKKASNWIMAELLRELADAELSIAQCPVLPKQLADMIGMIAKGDITGKIAKTVFVEMFKTGKDAAVIVDEKGLKPINDDGAILEFVQKAMDENPAAVEDFRNGSQKVIGFLVGQIMKFSRGKANPQQVQKILREKLGE